MKKKLSFWNEKWKKIEEINLKGNVYIPKYEYQISQYGRVKRRKEGEKDFSLINHTNLGKYKVFVMHFTDGKKRNQYVHRMLGLYFLEKPSEEHTVIAFKNYDLSDLRLENLAWMTKSEHSRHTTQGKAYKAAHKSREHKLTAERVAFIKKIIFDPNRKTRMKVIAKQFGISEMQLNRIKRGENWGHVKPLD